MGLTNLDHVKHVGLTGDGEGSVVRLYLKLDPHSPNIHIECASPEEAHQTMKRIEKMLLAREELLDPRATSAKTED